MNEDSFINLPEIDNYFGKTRELGANELWIKSEKKNLQLDLFDTYEPTSYNLSISDFVTSLMCPKLFNAYYLSGEIPYTPHHPIVEVGSQFDKFAKKFLLEPFENRNKNLLLDELELELNQLKNNKLSQYKIEFYLNSFNDFCDFFNPFKSIHNRLYNKRLFLNINGMRLSGKFDLLLENIETRKVYLIDLKLGKYGDGIESFKFYDFIQSIIYYLALQRIGISVDYHGYYFFDERFLIYERTSDFKSSLYHTWLRKIVESLLHTTSFRPKKCMFCLICPLKSECEIGSKLTSFDFNKPLG